MSLCLDYVLGGDLLSQSGLTVWRRDRVPFMSARALHPPSELKEPLTAVLSWERVRGFTGGSLGQESGLGGLQAGQPATPAWRTPWAHPFLTAGCWNCSRHPGSRVDELYEKSQQYRGSGEMGGVLC